MSRRQDLPMLVAPFERAIVRCKHVLHVLIAAVLEDVAAKRDDAPAGETVCDAALVIPDPRPAVRRHEAQIAGDPQTSISIGQGTFFFREPQINEIRAD